MKPVYLAILILTLATSSFAAQRGNGRGPAQGARGPQQGARGPAQMDTDGDGRISRSEWPGADQAFSRLDADGDGFITRNEMTNRRANGARAGDIRNRDTDGDGRISRDEWPGADGLFQRFDTNQDGFLTQDELRAQRQDQPGNRGGGFDRMDTDGDGRISRSEWSRADQLFDRLDTDGDGYVSQDEMPGRSGTAPQGRGRR